MGPSFLSVFYRGLSFFAPLSVQVICVLPITVGCLSLMPFFKIKYLIMNNLFLCLCGEAVSRQTRERNIQSSISSTAHVLPFREAPAPFSGTLIRSSIRTFAPCFGRPGYHACL